MYDIHTYTYIYREREIIQYVYVYIYVYVYDELTSLLEPPPPPQNTRRPITQHAPTMRCPKQPKPVAIVAQT